jgi:hypothetical protein
MGGECMAHGREVDVQIFTGKPEDHIVNGRIVLK